MLNPFLDFLLFSIIWFFLSLCADKNFKFIILSYIFCAVAAQFHLSFISIIVPFFLITYRLKLIGFFKKSQVLVAIFLFFYFPFILDNFLIFENFDSTKKFY